VGRGRSGGDDRTTVVRHARAGRAGALPDGTNPTDPVGSFPHIPYYAIGCTLDAIQAESLDGRMSVEVFGHSAGGRPMYLVTINQLATNDQRKAFQNWQKLRGDALDDRRRPRDASPSSGNDFKVPIFIQSAIHGNEYEGVDATMPPHQPTRDDAVRHRSLGRQRPRPRDRRRQHRPKSGRPGAEPAPTATGSTSTVTSSRSRSPRYRRPCRVMQKWLFPDMLDQPAT
jgi:hypothetical protein